MRSLDLKPFNSNAMMVKALKLSAKAYRDEVIKNEPRGDWEPLLMCESAEGEVMFTPIPPIWMSSDQLKEGIAEAMTSLLLQGGAVRAGLLISSLTLRIEPQADGSLPDVMDRPRPIEALDSVEVLTLQVIDLDGEELWQAPIKRIQGMGPMLGDWEELGPGVRTSGRFPDALRAGLNVS
jgi:hypothetical protein